MSRRLRLARRAAFSVVGALAVLSAAFLLASITPVGLPYRGGTLLDRYVAWLADFLTLQWGTTSPMLGRFGTREMPVVDAVAAAIPYTLAYLVPAVAVSAVLGVSVGTYAALNPNGRVDRLASLLAYLGYALPNFVLGSLLVMAFAIRPLLAEPAYNDGPIQHVLWPAALLSTTLVATQFRYARAQSREYLGTEFVKLVRSKGAGRLEILRHVLRNAALPLVSLFVVETFAVLVVAFAVVESVFQIPGLGWLLLSAAFVHDVPTVLGATAVFVVAGFLGNFLQDVAYVLLDPRVGET